ncbi:hypothetical protein AVEN_236797-1 [Araneus ventricosus]|uniref:Uncharacterized protein n=1 Tax=Araneus ventricosus TaxID=182803 RepID=A0A4Y2K7B6_ARAVE|nr:hypothetical protein AVEN_236797-1 [Araneus ventricosus]
MWTPGELPLRSSFLPTIFFINNGLDAPPTFTLPQRLADLSLYSNKCLVGASGKPWKNRLSAIITLKCDLTQLREEHTFFQVPKLVMVTTIFSSKKTLSILY